MAMAAHVPNCCCVMPKHWPMTGKMNSAMALRMNMVPSATVISVSRALMTGPTAAMALPPQMAVPELMR